MRKIQDLSFILWERIFKLRKNSCIGCICEHNFQKYHNICLNNINHNYYFNYALDTLLFEQIITNHEKQLLENLNKSNENINSTVQNGTGND